MLRRHLIAGGAACGPALLGLAGRAAASCAAPLADVPLTLTAGLPLVPVTIDGTTIAFVLDTGAERTIGTAALMRAMGLAQDPWVSERLTGVGGTAVFRHADVQSMTVGPVALRRRSLPDVRSLPVSPTLGGFMGGQRLGGLLGLDLLDAYDVDIDFVAGRLRLWAPGQACPGADTVAAERPRGALFARLSAGGRAIPAMIDTGTSDAALSPQGAIALGVAGEGGGYVKGVNGDVIGKRAQFEATLGPVRLGSLSAAVTPLPDGTAAILGSGAFHDRRLVLRFAPPGIMLSGTGG